MKMLYQIKFFPHGRSAKTKASIEPTSPTTFDYNRNKNENVLSVLAQDDQDAARQLAELIAPEDKRPLMGTSYLRGAKVKALKVDDIVYCPTHTTGHDDAGNPQTMNIGIVTEVLGDDPSTAFVGLHLFTYPGWRLTFQHKPEDRQYYAREGKPITVDFPTRQCQKIGK
jgi:hypothetical protein